MNRALAFIIGIPVVRILIENFSWMTPFFFLTGIGLFFFILFAVIVPAHTISRTSENSLWKNLRRVFSTWPAVAGLIMAVMMTAANETVNLIFGVWIESQFGLNFAALTAASVVIGISELGGEVSTGIWLDKVGKHRMIWIFIGVNILAALLLPLTSNALGWALAGLGLFYISFEIVLISSLTLMSEVMPVSRATTIA